jgi:hypothetical protein
MIYLGVNYIYGNGRFLEAGDPVPDGVNLPAWVIRKHRIGAQEAFQLREDKRLRREMVERQRAAAERKAATATPPPNT